MSDSIKQHKGHRVEVSSYGQEDGYNVAADCWTCWKVIEDKDVATSDEASDLAAEYRREAGII